MTCLIVRFSNSIGVSSEMGSLIVLNLVETTLSAPITEGVFARAAHAFQ
jgi:hypothetical protein